MFSSEERLPFLDFGIKVLNYSIVWQRQDDLDQELVLEFVKLEDKGAPRHDTMIRVLSYFDTSKYSFSEGFNYYLAALPI